MGKPKITLESRLDQLTVSERPKNGRQLSQRQVGALRAIERIGDEIAREHPEVADMYRDLEQMRGYLDIAKHIIPEEASTTPNIAKYAVRDALRRLLPEDEMATLVKAHKRYSFEHSLRRRFGDTHSEAYSAHCSRAGKSRYEQGGIDAAAMVRARGQIPRKDEEKKFTIMLANDSGYQYQEGQHESQPDLKMIANEVNNQFFEGREVRNPNGVVIFLRHHKTDRGYKI